jgi:hypothetical protein
LGGTDLSAEALAKVEGEGKENPSSCGEGPRISRMIADQRMIVGIGIAIAIGIVSLLSLAAAIPQVRTQKPEIRIQN